MDNESDPLLNATVTAPTRSRGPGGSKSSESDQRLLERLIAAYDARAEEMESTGIKWCNLPLSDFCRAVGPQEYHENMNVNSWKGALQVRLNKLSYEGRTVRLKMHGPRIENGFRPTEDSVIHWQALSSEERASQLNRRTR